VGIGTNSGRLAVSVSISGYDQFAFWAPICNTGSAFLTNYVLSADVTVVGPEMPYGVMFGYIIMDDGTADSSVESMVLTAGLNSPIRVTLAPGRAVTGLGFSALISGAWEGTIYLDNVRVTAP
jgi:hypothetical protein